MAGKVAFEGFVFDRAERTLWCAGAIVPLPLKAADALCLLLAEPGALVSKETLRDRLWPEGFIDDGNLTQTIYVLRRTLDPDGDGRRFIETVPRRGYRFAAPATVANPEAAVPAAGPEQLSLRTIRFRLAGAAAIVLLLLGFSFVNAAQGRVRSAFDLPPDAARAYALGRYWWNKRTPDGMAKSIAYFTEVAQRAPRSALGYAALSGSYAMMANRGFARGAERDRAYARAEDFARRALALDPNSGESLATLGLIDYAYRHDLAKAEAELDRAVALRPTFSSGLEYAAIVELELGKVGPAIEHLQRAVEAEPLSPTILSWLGAAYFEARRFAEARPVLRQALDLDPLNVNAAYHTVMVEAYLGNREGALKMIPLAYAEMPDAPRDRRAATAFVLWKTGDAAGAQRAMPDLTPPVKLGELDTFTYVALCLMKGRTEDALAWIQAYASERRRLHEPASSIADDPRVGDLLNDPRFQALVQ